MGSAHHRRRSRSNSRCWVLRTHAAQRGPNHSRPPPTAAVLLVNCSANGRGALARKRSARQIEEAVVRCVGSLRLPPVFSGHEPFGPGARNGAVNLLPEPLVDQRDRGLLGVAVLRPSPGLRSTPQT
mmetsp:Transcript_84028/g.166903  ORF Transcript_84028/g.166903 Transcript_84028/m.166903 type:complete len:127 (-) Transcript_84028:96-476(-)